MLRLPGPAKRTAELVAASSAQPVSLAFDFSQFVAAAPAGAVVVPRTAAIDAFLEMCRQPELAARIACRLPNALGNGMPAADVSLGRMLLRRTAREESGKQAVEQEATVGALPVRYHPELQAQTADANADGSSASASPSPAPTRKTRRAAALRPSGKRRARPDDEAEEGDESDCSTEHSSQHGELLGDEERSDGDDDATNDSFVVSDDTDDDRALQSHVNSESDDGELVSSSSSSFVASDGDDDDEEEDSDAVLSGGDDTESPLPRRKTRSVKSLRDVPMHAIAKKILLVDKEDMPDDEDDEDDDDKGKIDDDGDDEDDADSESDAEEPSDSAIAEDDDDEIGAAVLGVEVCDSDSDTPAPPVQRRRLAPPESGDDEPAPAPAPAAAAVAPKAKAPSKPRVRIAPRPSAAAPPPIKFAALTPTDVVYAAMLFAAAVRHALPADGPRSVLHALGDANRAEPPTPHELQIRDAYFALVNGVGDRFALLARLYRAYQECELKQEAELRKVAARLAPTVRRIK